MTYLSKGFHQLSLKPARDAKATGPGPQYDPAQTLQPANRAKLCALDQALSALLFLYKELLGHASVETTMIYTHVMTKGGRGVRSPLDRAEQPRATYGA